VNDVIPVLRLEVDEFFNCSDYDGFRAAASLDPLLTGTDGPGVPILASGGLHDTEVMYWEPLKWTTHLRKKGWAKIACRIDEETGHFMQGMYALKKRAEESAWLHSSIGLN
jgi:oligopeptidase B